MAKNIPEKIRFLNEEITGLKARIGATPNAIQRGKLKMFVDILDDYEDAASKAFPRAQAQRQAQQGEGS